MNARSGVEVIDLDYLPRLFDRFWRAPDSLHDRVGLGVAICREIASHTTGGFPSGTQLVVSF